MTTFESIADQLDGLAVEVPSWAYGNSGTRFKVFTTPGTPRTVQEKIDDAAQVHRYTGLAPAVALHIPWDTVEDYAALRRYAEDRGLRLGAHLGPAVDRPRRRRLADACQLGHLVERGRVPVQSHPNQVTTGSRLPTASRENHSALSLGVRTWVS